MFCFALKKGSQQLCGHGQMGESVPEGCHRLPSRVLSLQVVMGAQIRPALSQSKPDEELLRQLRRLSPLPETQGRRQQGLRVL